MNSEVLGALIPIVSVLAVFGMPVALVFVNKFFKLREKELALEQEAQHWAEKQSAQLEARVQRIESVLMSLDQDLRAKLSQAAPHERTRPELMEGPGSGPAEEAARAAAGGKTKI